METQKQRASDRRAAPERRLGSDRRRHSDARIPIIQIGHSMLRLAIVADQAGDEEDLVITRSLRWRNEAQSLHTEKGITELKEALATLSAEERLSGTRARVLLNSDLCVTRAITGASEEVQRETGQLRERSQLYLSLGPGKKVIASSSTLLDARHSHALLTVATQNTLIVVSSAVEAAGMQIEVIESAQVALARLIGRSSADDQEASIVVQVDEGGIELGVMSGGRLFLDYRPGGHTHIDQLADLVKQHHARLKRYCQRHHGLEKTELKRIYVSGEEDEAQKAVAALKSLSEVEVELLDVRTLEFPWKCRRQEIEPEMACVLGAALVLTDEEFALGPNLVEHLLASARPPVGKMLLRKFAPLAASLFLGAVFGLLNWQANHHVDLMQAELGIHAPEAARANALRLRLLAADRKLRQLSALTDSLPLQPVAVLLQNVTASIPSEVWLTTFRVDGGASATIAGSSYAESSIYDFVSHLQNVPGIADVALESTGVARTKTGNATTFDLNVDLALQQSPEPTGEPL
ncbi:MAG: PilN domain-containing protein [Aeoliella sp.]